MFNSINWKLRQHSDLIRYGIDHKLLLDLLSHDYKKTSFRAWSELPKIYAESLGFIFSDRTPASSLWDIFVDRIYDVASFAPERGQVVIDVGANYGDSAIWWSKKYGAKVIAFEPLPDVYSVLEENIRLNRADVVAHNLALSDGSIVKGSRSNNGSMLLAGGEMELKSARLDDFNLEKADILKIDVEGFEYSVLNGSMETIKRLKPRIIIETHSKDLRKKCHEFLISMGYKIHAEGKTIISKTKGMDKLTNLFYSI